MSFDLLKFADHETRIPARLLAPEKEAKIFFRGVAAWCFDLYMVMAFTFTCKFLIAENIKALFISDKFTSDLYEKVGDLGPAFIVCWISYFAFSYFFNHGQTYGMQYFKLRLEIPHHSFKASLKFAFKSLGFFSVWKSYKSHDYLYQKLMEIREEAAPELTSLIKDEEVPPLPFEIAA